MSPRDLYELDLLHQKTREEDEKHRKEIRKDVEANWPKTQALLDHLYEQRMAEDLSAQNPTGDSNGGE